MYADFNKDNGLLGQLIGCQSDGCSENSLMEAILRYFLSKALKPLNMNCERSPDLYNKYCMEDFLKQAMSHYLLSLTHNAEAVAENYRSFEEKSPVLSTVNHICLPEQKEGIPVEEAPDAKESQNEPASECMQMESENQAASDMPKAASFEISASCGDDKPEEKKNLEKILGIKPAIIETHNSFIIRVKLAEGIDERSLDISINSLCAYIRYKSDYAEQLIPLPDSIDINKATAKVLGDTLEIIIPKSSGSAVKELSIRHF